MKLDNGGPRTTGGDRPDGTKRAAGGTRLSPLPVEWMDPMSWRLPSGKALAEFALQSGFLAPPMLGRMMLGSSMGDGRIRRVARAAKTGAPKKEVPASTGNFRENEFRKAGIGAGHIGAGQQG